MSHKHKIRESNLNCIFDQEDHRLNVMEHVFCIRWQAGMNESMSKEMDDELKHNLLYY